MTDEARGEAVTRCSHVGTIVIGGRPVGEVRCELDAGHEVARWHHYNGRGEYTVATPHRASFEWEDELPIVFDMPEASIEVEVPLTDVDGDR